MNISQTFIERPIATSLMMAAIALFGAVAYRSLPVSDLPNVDLPTLLVTASLPGASPETMAAAVASDLPPKGESHAVPLVASAGRRKWTSLFRRKSPSRCALRSFCSIRAVLASDILVLRASALAVR